MPGRFKGEERKDAAARVKRSVAAGVAWLAAKAKEALRRVPALSKSGCEHALEALRNLGTLPPPLSVLRSLAVPRRLLIVAVLIPAFFALGLLYQQSHRGEVIARKALAAVEQPGRITYYKVSHRLTGVVPSRSSTWQAEYWIDYGRGIAKTVRRTAGVNKTLSTTTLVKGAKPLKVEKVAAPLSAYEYEMVGNAPLPFSDRIRDGVTLYREMLKSGKVKLLRKEKVGGIRTFRLKTETVDNGKNIKDIMTVNVRGDNYYPVKAVHEVWTTGQHLKNKRLKSVTTTFKTVSLVEPRDLGDKFFSLQAPKGADQDVARTYALDKIKGFTEFDLYYLGRSFKGYELGSFVYSKQGRSKKLKDVSDTRVMVAYLNPQQTDGLYLTIRPIVKPSVIASELAPVGEKTRVKINGKAGTLNEVNNGQITFYRLFINSGSSTVEINARDKSLAVNAAENLIRVNGSGL